MRFFLISEKSLRLREVRFFKTTMLGSGLVVGLFVVGAVLLVNQLTGDMLGIGFDRMSALIDENRVLRNQVRDLGERLGVIQKSLDGLSERGNELRLVADLKRIDDDTRGAAVGGSRASFTGAFLSGEAEDVLASTQSLIDKLSREVKLQQTSYEEIARRLEYNRGLFAHMPAIKPMTGSYSVNGFGMRVHPVLRVYRMHAGLDIINDVGNDVYATGDGTVVFSGRTAGGYGIVVEVSHGYGFSTLYAHLSKVLVHPGQTIKRGELVAKSGRSGLVSGPHLHYEVRRNGARQNPVDYFFDDVDAARYRSQLASVH
jgi:murein DD-endopeptidase MepM/ murein hydrolase activator NlpD